MISKELEMEIICRSRQYKQDRECYRSKLEMVDALVADFVDGVTTDAKKLCGDIQRIVGRRNG